MNKPNKRVLCFGELLLRLQSTSDSFFEKDKNTLKIYTGGSEANVAVTLGQLGIPTSYFSAIPQNALSNEIEQILETNYVDITKILHQGERIGSYYLLSANGLTNGEVIYDRNFSAFSNLKISDIDWDNLFDGIDWIHFTAISPALNQQLADLTLFALEQATKKGITISVDLNYRSKLWQYGKNPIDIMPNLIQYVDVVMGNIWAANKMLGTTIDESFSRSTSKDEYIAFANQTAEVLFTKFPKVKHVANTYRFMDNPTHNLFYGTYHNRNTHTYSQPRETNEVIDRIGSGDAFMGGLIYALLHDLSAQQIIDTATAAGFEKLFVEGDFGNGKI
ncbi:sugar kinase [Sphingobacterium bovistauri]|uniref:Sugar kinase n=1 Tax=Sphingobacterium bovistauri TaxID=2781959 RepID=A0ABS7Z4K7_9SPHI|nr:sugar kinase [Sphingobacterium bovistauri]MCA5004482.1 sugar kinase [Sphingobacterium bovistauri]